MEIKLRFFVIPNSSAFLFSLCSAMRLAGWLECCHVLVRYSGRQEKNEASWRNMKSNVCLCGRSLFHTASTRTALCKIGIIVLFHTALSHTASTGTALCKIGVTVLFHTGPRFNRRLDDPLKHPSKCPSRERPCTNFFPSTHDGKSKRSF